METLIEHGDARLLVDPDPRFLILEKCGVRILRTATVPQWINPDPVRAAKMVLATMRPDPPKLDLDAAVANVVGGTYYANNDTVRVFGREEMSERHLAVLLLHEGAHATGLKSRCAREDYRDVQPYDAPLDLARTAERFQRRDEPVDMETEREELVAGLAAAFVAVALGVLPSGSSHCSRWIERASKPSPGVLAAAIRDSIAAATWMLHGTEPAAEMLVGDPEADSTRTAGNEDVRPGVVARENKALGSVQDIKNCSLHDGLPQVATADPDSLDL